MRSTPHGHQTAPVFDDAIPRHRPHAGQTRIETVVVLLAAGAGVRFTGTGHKLSAKLSETAHEPAATVLERAIDHALAADIGPVIVVTGAATDTIPARFDGLVLVQFNPRWAEGQMTSVRSGLERAVELGASAAIVGLGDQPFISPQAWRAVASSPGPIAVATYDGRRANPVRLNASVWDLLPTTGDEGARSLMRVRPELVREVPCTGSPADIDTAEDLSRWQSN